MERRVLTIKKGLKKRAIFFDRDGVLLADSRDLSKPVEIRVLPDAFEAVRRARASGFKIVVVSNQSRVARGVITLSQLYKNDIKFRKMFKYEGAKIDMAYYCPHHPDFGGKCSCRKPQIGLFKKAQHDLYLNIEDSYTVGDQLSDIEAGFKAGCRKRVLIGKNSSKAADYNAASVLDAVDWILKNQT